MDKTLLIIIILMVVAIVCWVNIGISNCRENASKRRYMSLLIEECDKELTNPKTVLRYHTHKFDWDYFDSTLKAQWDVWTPNFSVTAYGTSEQTRDVENIDEFFNVSKINYVTIYIHNKNLTALHSYYDKYQVNRLINAMKTVEANNGYLSVDDMRGDY